jgi:carbon starvation protein
MIIAGWSYFVWTGNISTIWPMFGIANQLLAAVALTVATTVVINSGRAKYAWVTAVPLCFLTTTTLTAGVLSVKNQYWPMATGPNEALHVQGMVQSILSVMMMIAVVVILASALRKWFEVLSSGRAPNVEAELA